jgi:hypothetical protein
MEESTESSKFSECAVLNSLCEIFSKQLNYESSRFNVLKMKCWKDLEETPFLYSQLIAVIFSAFKCRSLNKILVFIPAIIEMNTSPCVITQPHPVKKAVKHVRFCDDVLKHECPYTDDSDKIPYHFTCIHQQEIVKEEKLQRCKREAKQQEDLQIATMDPEDLIQVRRRSESDVSDISAESLNEQLLFLKTINSEGCPHSFQSRKQADNHPNRRKLNFNIFKLIFSKMVMVQ